MTPNRFAFFCGQIIPIENAKISIMAHVVNYGTGVFEGIRAYWNDQEKQLFVFKLREHFDRFLDSCHILMIKLPYTNEQLCNFTLELLRRERFETNTYIRPLAFKATEGIGVRLHGLDDACAIFAVPFTKYIESPGARATVASWRRLDDNAIPARAKVIGSYVNSALAKSEAVLKGFDEAIVLDQTGHVSEGSAENIFVVRERTLITPPVTSNILEGVTRKLIMQLAHEELHIETVERELDRTELYVCDEVFFCGTGVEIVPVIEIDHRPVGNGQPGPCTRKLSELYHQIVRGNHPRYRQWCTPVYNK